METLKQIIGKHMSTRPEYYSGRGAILCDLNSDILQGIYLGIKEKFGDEPAENYVKMVEGIKVISATTFLQELYSLFYNKWKYTTKENDECGISVPKDKDGNYDIMHGMIGMFEAMSNNRDETRSIKGGFLRAHGVAPKGKYESREDGNIYCYYE